MNFVENKSTLWARYLLFLLPIVIVVSPTLTSFLEVILYVLFVSSPELRKRFFASLSQPMVYCGLLLLFLMLLSSLWSDASWEVKLEHVISWRKVFFLPFAVSLLNNDGHKDKFLLVFVACIGIFALLSWFSYITEITLIKPPHAMLRNHATQGMVFFVGAFVSIFLLTYRSSIPLFVKVVCLVAFLALITNSFIVSTSRSGYLLGIVLIGCFGFYLGGKKTVLSIVLLWCIAISAFYASPTSNERVKTMLKEIIAFDTTEVLTSGGARVFFWENTFPLVMDNFLLGSGLKSFSLEYASQVESQKGWRGRATRDPHNQYLLLLVEQGIVGLLVFFIFIMACFLQKPPLFYRFLGGSVLLGWMATSLFNGHFSSSVEGKFIFLWCGALLAMPLGVKAKLKLRKKLFRALKIELIKYKKHPTVNSHIINLITHYKIDLVLDVGANNGGFGAMLRAEGYKGEIQSFEPVFSTFNELKDIVKADSDWHINRLALGATSCEKIINITGSSDMASFLESSEFGEDLYRENLNVIAQETVTVSTVDAFLTKHIENFETRNIFLKMDTQGYDAEVVQGAKNSLRHISCALSEISLIPLYNGMPHYLDSLKAYENLGLAVTGLYPVSRKKDLSIMEMDCVMLNKHKAHD